MKESQRMSDRDFDEPSRHKLAQRRAARRRKAETGDERVVSSGEAGERTTTPLRPDWRAGRTTGGGRRSATATLSSPQEFQLWLQRGGWMVIALAALVVVLALVFLLMQTRAESPNPFSSTSSPGTGQVSAGGSDASGAAGGDSEAPATSGGNTELQEIFEQPTVTPLPATEPPAASGEFFVVSGTGTNGLFLRPGPSTDGGPIKTLPEGTRVEKIGEDEFGANFVWRPVRDPEGAEGWVAVDFLQPAP
jgi:hypothetical protein